MSIKFKVVKTEFGYEFASFFQGEWVIEPDACYPTRKEAQAALDADLEEAERCDAADRAYQSGYASACGY